MHTRCQGASCYAAPVPCGPRRSFVALAAALAALGVFAGGLAWLLDPPRPTAGASRGERLYYAHCVTCHGEDGRGSWRAVLFLIRPGDLSDAARMTQHTDQYLFDIIKHGGAPLGRPGMPAFGFHLSDEDVVALVRHMRALARPGRRRPQRSTSIRSRTSSSSRGRTASRTRSPGRTPLPSSIAGSAVTAISSIAGMPSPATGA